MSDSLHIADPGNSEGFSLAHFVSHLGITPGRPATFLCREPGDLESAWRLWQETFFAPRLAPAFVDTYLCGTEFRLDEIQAVDTLLDAGMPDAARRRSLETAFAFLEGKEEMRANSEWKRFAGRVARGETPGHATILFALQSALYHLPLASALTAYAWFEFQSGRPGRSSATEVGNVIFESVIPLVQVALRGKNGDAAGGSGQLRAI
ncbi:MAG: hypothetical protein WD342_01065 [Verrucomicrobiales bacterium]